MIKQDGGSPLARIMLAAAASMATLPHERRHKGRFSNKTARKRKETHESKEVLDQRLTDHLVGKKRTPREYRRRHGRGRR